jgi:hypothetical protein
MMLHLLIKFRNKYGHGSRQMTTLRPKKLPVAASRWRMLLVLKLEKTSVAVVLPLFRASSQSSSAVGGKIFFGDCRRKRPLLLKREMSCNTMKLKKARLFLDYITRPKHKCITTVNLSSIQRIVLYSYN